MKSDGAEINDLRSVLKSKSNYYYYFYNFICHNSTKKATRQNTPRWARDNESKYIYGQIRLQAKPPYHTYNLWLVACSFLLSRQLFFCWSDYMKFGPDSHTYFLMSSLFLNENLPLSLLMLCLLTRGTTKSSAETNKNILVIHQWLMVTTTKSHAGIESWKSVDSTCSSILLLIIIILIIYLVYSVTNTKLSLGIK